VGAEALIPPRDLRLAAAAYPVAALPDRAALAAKLTDWVSEAAAAGADLLAFPEYAGIEAALAGAGPGPDVAGWCARSADAAGWYVAQMTGLARRFGLHVLAGSLPVATAEGLVNCATLVTPEGRAIAQDKSILTPWERRNTPLVPGRGPVAAETGLGRLGTLICYDAEFPLLARRLRADILLVPSCTDTPHGATRLRVAAMARALEGQAIVVAAPLLGAVPWCGLVDANTGRAGIYAPPDVGLPDSGVLAEAATDRPGWVYADLPAGVMSEARRMAAVDVPGHWPESDPR
jgi:predicted amidohydrolase